MLNTVEESAEGIVGEVQVKLLGHSNAERPSNRQATTATCSTEGLNGAPRGA